MIGAGIVLSVCGRTLWLILWDLVQVLVIWWHVAWKESAGYLMCWVELLPGTAWIVPLSGNRVTMSFTTANPAAKVKSPTEHSLR